MLSDESAGGNRASRQEINRQILAGIDIQAVYRELGVNFPEGRRTSDKGWLDCHAIDREDSNPSAGVNVGDGPARGRYRDLGGIGLSLSLFDFAAQFGGYEDWRAARKEFARRAGVKLGDGGHRKLPIDALEFLPWRRYLVRQWCDIHGGITVRAVEEAGGRLALWPANAKRAEHQQTVIAFPGYGWGLTEDDPVAWVVVRQDGELVRHYKGKGQAPVFAKTLSVSGSQPCLLNRWACAHLEGAEVVWKVESLTDMLALHTFIPPELKDKHVVLTNGCGALEPLQNWWGRALEGKDVRVVGAADEPGQIGATRWVANLTATATKVRNVQLPFERAPSHGKGAKDFTVEQCGQQAPQEVLDETVGLATAPADAPVAADPAQPAGVTS